MSKQLIERLRKWEEIPESDDAAFRFLMRLTDEAADRLEELERELAGAKIVSDHNLKVYQEAAGKLRDHVVLLRDALESAFREGFRSPATYNDVVLNSEDDEWNKSEAKEALAATEEMK